MDSSVFAGCEALIYAKLSPITRINDSLFYNCKALTTVIIPNGAETIEGSAFQGCRSLTNVSLPGTLKRIAMNSLNVNCKDGKTNN